MADKETVVDRRLLVPSSFFERSTFVSPVGNHTFVYTVNLDGFLPSAFTLYCVLGHSYRISNFAAVIRVIHGMKIDRLVYSKGGNGQDR
jgi:hypothetical protein